MLCVIAGVAVAAAVAVAALIFIAVVLVRKRQASRKLSSASDTAFLQQQQKPGGLSGGLQPPKSEPPYERSSGNASWMGENATDGIAPLPTPDITQEQVKVGATQQVTVLHPGLGFFLHSKSSDQLTPDTSHDPITFNTT
jgi:hypothetical protein